MSASGEGDRSGAARMARRHSGPATRDELAPGMLMRAMGVGVEDEGATAGERADPAPSAARARLAVAAVIAGTALLAGVLGPGAGAGRHSGESGSNMPAAAGVAGSVESQGDSFVKTKKFGSDVVLGAAAAAAVSISALAGDAVQWRVADGGNGHWYAGTQLADESSPVNWWDAASLYCRERGGHLATPTSASENDFIIANAMTQIPPQSGLGRGPMLGGRLEDNGWQWIDGEPWRYSAWCGPEPTGDGIHLQYWAFSYPCWNDFPGTVAYSNTLIIEWSADCNSDGVVDYGQILAGNLTDTNANGIPDCCEPGNRCCLGDIDMNHIVDGGDLGILLCEWGAVTPATRSDLNGDRLVNGADLDLQLANWGPCNP